ncbi:MAG: chemotaxis protein CheX, partial [Terriglobia bacterium]
LHGGEVTIEHGMLQANDGLLSFVGVAGWAWTGTGSLTCSPVLACRIHSRMLLTETAAVDEEVLDAVAELTSMIVGGVKTDLEQHLGPLGLSIPTVIFGRNFKIKSAGRTEWIVVKFPWDEEVLLVKLCLIPKGTAAHAMSQAAGQLCALEP